MELMFDGQALAEPSAAATAKANREEWEAWRKLLQSPPDAKAIAGLAPHYRNAALGDLYVKHTPTGAVFDVGSWSSSVATQPQQDGSVSFMTIDPVALGFAFVRADKDGARRLIARDGQHEYVFDEVK
jgi:hypothetical protein